MITHYHYHAQGPHLSHIIIMIIMIITLLITIIMIITITMMMIVRRCKSVAFWCIYSLQQVAHISFR